MLLRNVLIHTWLQAPDSITKGTFPDSIISPKLSDYDDTYDSKQLSYSVQIATWPTGKFETYGDTRDTGLFPIYAKYWYFYFYANAADTFSFRIRTLRIIEVLI